MVAAKAMLRKPFLTGAVVDEFDDIPASAAWKLLDYHRECNKCCVSLAETWRTWITIEDMPRPLGNEGPANGYGSPTPCACSGSVRITKSHRSNGRSNPELWVSQRFVTLMNAICNAVKSAPHPSSVTSLAVVGHSLVTASSCSDCQEGAARAVEAFTRRFAEKIDGVISKIDIATPF